MGLLTDFLQTPEGIGLLSVAAGAMTGARRGEPWNTAGRGLTAGLMGYAGAQELARNEKKSAVEERFKALQMGQLQRQIEQQKAQDAWRAGLPGIMNNAQPKVEQFQPDDPFNQGSAAFGEGVGGQQVGSGMVNVHPGNPQALQDYLMNKDSPFADELIKQQIMPKAPDYKVVGNTLLETGRGGVKPVYTTPDKVDYNKPFLPNGSANPAYQQYEIDRSRAGANRQSVVVNPALDPFKNEQSLRKEYQDNPLVKSAADMTNSFRMIDAAYKRPSAANDLAMATKYMKILDPTSVVRESEFALAVNATGVMDKVYNYANMIKTGQKLNPVQRKDFYDSAKAINDAFQEEAGKVKNTYRGIANQYGLSPENTTLGAEFIPNAAPGIPKGWKVQVQK